MTIASKGSSLSIGSGNAAAAIASLISIDGPEVEAETYEADTLDNTNAGIPYLPSGRVEGGKISAEGFLVSGNKSAVLASIANLATNCSKNGTTVASVISYGSGNSAVAFNQNLAGLGISPSAALKEGVKVKITGKVSGDVT